MNIDSIHAEIEKDGIIFISYDGVISQSVISELTEKLEVETEGNDIKMGIANNMLTIFVELSQNMMNYSKNEEVGSREISPNGIIVVSKDSEENYYIDSQNILSVDDKEKITPKLIDITTLDRDGIKKRYKELRRSGKDSHEKGGGLGFYEIAKRCDEVSYDFASINEDKEYFHLRAKIVTKKD
jgi:hypothetical protein